MSEKSWCRGENGQTARGKKRRVYIVRHIGIKLPVPTVFCPDRPVLPYLLPLVYCRPIWTVSKDNKRQLRSLGLIATRDYRSGSFNNGSIWLARTCLELDPKDTVDTVSHEAVSQFYPHKASIDYQWSL